MRFGAALLALLNLFAALIVAFLGFLANGLRCDDNCSIAPGWRNDPAAWQWGMLLALALGILVAAVLLNIAVWVRYARLGWAAGLGQALALVFIGVLNATADSRSGGSGIFVVLALLFCATAFAATRLAGPRPSRTD